MSIIRLSHREDFGHDWYAQILNLRGRSLLQVSVSWNDYPSWPYVQVKSGGGSLFDVLFWVYKFGLAIDILSYTWKFDYLKDIEVLDLTKGEQ
jgi:hypothetical protein